MAGAGAVSARGCSSRGIPPKGPAPPTIIPTTAAPSAASLGKTGAVMIFERIAMFVPYRLLPTSSKSRDVGKVPLSVDLRFQIGDLLLRSGNGVNICRQLGQRH